MSKKYKVIACAVAMFMVIFMNSLNVDASNAEDLKNTWYDTHYYPIYQGNSEWQKHSMEDTLEVNNPPYDLLFSMTSEELAKLIFAHPYLPQITSYYNTDGNNDYGQFYLFLELQSDIFYELLRREDGILAILKQYQESGVDSKWFTEEAYFNSENDQNKWYSEIFGSQFLHLYSKIFTKEETDLAKQILSEKNSIYIESPNAYQEYFDISDIEYYEGNYAGHIRTIYMNADKITERETEFDNAVSSIQQKESENEEEMELTDEKSQDEHSFFEAYGIYIGVIVIFLILLVILIIHRKKN